MSETEIARVLASIESKTELYFPDDIRSWRKALSNILGEFAQHKENEMENMTNATPDQERIRRLEMLVLERAQPKVNHILHIIVSIATGGFWLPVYGYLVWKASK